MLIFYWHILLCKDKWLKLIFKHLPPNLSELAASLWISCFLRSSKSSTSPNMSWASCTAGDDTPAAYCLWWGCRGRELIREMRTRAMGWGVYKLDEISCWCIECLISQWKYNWHLYIFLKRTEPAGELTIDIYFFFFLDYDANSNFNS
jgi:hypothetical protein